MNRGDVVLFVAQGDIEKSRPGVVVQADELGHSNNVRADLSDVIGPE